MHSRKLKVVLGQIVETWQCQFVDLTDCVDSIFQNEILIRVHYWNFTFFKLSICRCDKLKSCNVSTWKSRFVRLCRTFKNCWVVPSQPDFSNIYFLSCFEQLKYNRVNPAPPVFGNLVFRETIHASAMGTKRTSGMSNSSGVSLAQSTIIGAWFAAASHPPSQGNDRRSADAAANNRPTQCESDSNAYSALCVWIIWHVSVQAANTPARRKHDKESPVCPLRLRKTVKIPMHTWGPDSKLAALQESDHRPGRSASAGRI